MNFHEVQSPAFGSSGHHVVELPNRVHTTEGSRFLELSKG